VTSMSTNAIDCGMALVSVVVLMFILNRLGLFAWFSWVSRRKETNQDTSARKYGSAHE
jgi:predicted negative regulator of RcsB-dependent stress response